MERWRKREERKKYGYKKMFLSWYVEREITNLVKREILINL